MSDKWTCTECGWRGTEGEILSAPSPFEPAYTIYACPACKEIERFWGQRDTAGGEMSKTPSYYQAEIHGLADMYAIAKAHGITNPAVCHALKYLLRAGKKPGESAVEAIAKAQEALERAVEVEGIRTCATCAHQDWTHDPHSPCSLCLAVAGTSLPHWQPKD